MTINTDNYKGICQECGSGQNPATSIEVAPVRETLPNNSQRERSDRIDEGSIRVREIEE